MYVVSMLFKGSDLALAQHFNTFKNAEEFYRKAMKFVSGMANGIMENEDDFGSMVRVSSDSLAAVSFTDVEKDLEKNGKIQIMQHRSQLKTQSMAQSDSQIKLLNTASRIQVPS